MQTRIDEQLVEQAGRYHLRYACEDCGHFDHERVNCSLGYPDRPHRLRPFHVQQTMEFCKEFDLA